MAVPRYVGICIWPSINETFSANIKKNQCRNKKMIRFGWNTELQTTNKVRTYLYAWNHWEQGYGRVLFPMPWINRRWAGQLYKQSMSPIKVCNCYSDIVAELTLQSCPLRDNAKKRRMVKNKTVKVGFQCGVSLV